MYKEVVSKEVELKALEDIRRIVDGLGENSYVGTAFKGVWAIAKENIDYDFACSVSDLVTENYDLKEQLRVSLDNCYDLCIEMSSLKSDIEFANKFIMSFSERFSQEIAELKTKLFNVSMSI